jgi:hypothetical protein
MIRLALLLILLLAGAAQADRRVALVVGNDAYAEVPQLLKAGNDAEAVATTLSAQGFEVILVQDADRREMNRRLSQFTGQLRPGDTALVFYAGHGVEIDGENYLLPVDIVAPDSGDSDFVASEAIALSDLLDRVRATGARATIAIIDACRDNPFETATGRSIGGARGLGRVAAPEGTFVIFSAGAGQMALDRLSDADPDPNSVFTRALLPRLAEPGLELRDLVRATRLEVRELARSRNHAQFPAYYDELLGAFYLTPARSVSEPDPISEDFDLARELGTPEAFEAFLARHGNRADDFRVLLARRMLEDPAPGADAEAASTTAPAPAEPLDVREAIRAAQSALNALGCRAGLPDGIAGPRTRTAYDRLRGANPGLGLSLDEFGRRTARDGTPADLAACPEDSREAAAAPPPATQDRGTQTRRTASLAGTWHYSARCAFVLPVTGTMVARDLGGGRYSTNLSDSLGNSGRGTAILEGSRIRGSTDWTIVAETWQATLSPDGLSYSGTGSTGCSFQARRMN